MSLSIIKTGFTVLILVAGVVLAEDERDVMVKMCLFYPNESGHARTDPILNQDGPSDHVHTFYGPQNFHPNTSYENLLNTDPEFSSSPFIENQSLYWHPSIYRVTNKNGVQTYSRVNNLDTGPYYRWNNNTEPQTVEFPPGFRMIAFSDQLAREAPGDHVESLMVECCDFDGEDEEICTFSEGTKLIFPETTCDFLGISLNMPTCWNETKGIGVDDPFGHVAYTLDGTVGGDCPDGYDKRIPQVQLFIRINNYKGGTYQLSNDSDIFHVDFMTGWQEGKLTEIIEKCEPSGDPGYNPPCGCDDFLTESTSPAKAVCDTDVREHILDEATNVVTLLPRASNSDLEMVPKTWDVDPPFECKHPGVPCADSTLGFRFRRQMLSCEDVSDKLALCKKETIKSHCPQTCNSSSWCNKDSRSRFKLNKRFKNCRWIRRKPAKCGALDMCNTCRKSCQNFSQCQDTA